MKIELCIESFAEFQTAIRVKTDRVELCSALDVGGLTPSSGLIKQCSDTVGPEVHVLVRPRPGDFNYSPEELEIMKADFETSAKLGATGVVFGVLDLENNLPKEILSELMEVAKSQNLKSTFHRAFDFALNPLKTLHELVDLGFDRILTSGQSSSAIQGIHLIRDLVKKAEGKIEIMAGAGINASNASDLANSGIDAIHFSIRKKSKALELGMGNNFLPDEDKVLAIMKSISHFLESKN